MLTCFFFSFFLFRYTWLVTHVREIAIDDLSISILAARNYTRGCADAFTIKAI